MKLDIYDTLREFQKWELSDIMDRKDLTEFEEMALETLHGVLYLTAGVFCREGTSGN